MNQLLLYDPLSPTTRPRHQISMTTLTSGNEKDSEMEYSKILFKVKIFYERVKTNVLIDRLDKPQGNQQCIDMRVLLNLNKQITL